MLRSEHLRQRIALISGAYGNLGGSTRCPQVRACASRLDGRRSVRALLHHDGDRNMKVLLWRVRRNGGPLLQFAGTRLDAEGSFRQEFVMALPETYPWTVVIPAAGAGCCDFARPSSRACSSFGLSTRAARIAAP
jgi:hypothetical protein